MKLKSVVASMLALGLASGATLAATTNTVSRAEFDAMKDQVAKMEAVLNQHQKGSAAKQESAQTNDWANRITISGQIDVTTFWAADDHFRYQRNSNSNSGVELPNANIFIDAVVNDWVKAHAGLHVDHNVDRDGLANVYDALYNYDSNSWMDEAYVTVGNFAQSPFYVRAGREYVPFGMYDRNSITPSLTQMLTQTRANALQAGFVTANGFNGAVYAFNGTELDKNVGKRRVNNFGANLGFANSYNDVSYKASVGYIYNMGDVNYIHSGLESLTNPTGTQDHVVGGVSLDGSLQAGAFDASAHYVTALKKFHRAEVSYIDNSGFHGAKPSAWGVDAGYSFATAGHDSRLGVGYQRSSQANNVGPEVLWVLHYAMPKQRYVAQYDVNVAKNTDLGFQVYHDLDTKSDDGGFGNKNTTGVVRLSVKFA